MVTLAFICTNVRYPHGGASASFVKAFTNVISKKGVSLKVFIPSATEDPENILNERAKGIFQNTYFEYTSGTTLRNNNYFVRNMIKLAGVIKCIRNIIKMRKDKALDIVFAYSPCYIQDFFIIYACIYKKIPVSVYLCEWWPVLMRNKSKIRMKMLMYILKNVDGVVVVSDYLKQKVSDITEDVNKKRNIIKIIPAVNAFNHPCGTISQSGTREGENFVWCGHVDAYKDILEFVFRSFKFLQDEGFSEKLCLYGESSGAGENELLSYSDSIGLDRNRIIFRGFVDKEVLVRECLGSKGLLLPLMDITRDKARFPIKLGEYLSYGKPIVATGIGENLAYLVDRKNAILCRPNDERSFFEGMKFILKNDKKSFEIGQEGKRTFNNMFDFEKNHANKVVDHFKTIISGNQKGFR